MYFGVGGWGGHQWKVASAPAPLWRDVLFWWIQPLNRLAADVRRPSPVTLPLPHTPHDVQLRLPFRPSSLAVGMALCCPANRTPYPSRSWKQTIAEA